VSAEVRYRWSAGDGYERYVGRWSRVVAGVFVTWLGLPKGARCVDVGCGPGALGSTLLATGAGVMLGLDRSHGYLAAARERTQGSGTGFAVADAQALPVPDARFDAAVSGLVLNFVPRPERMLAEMVRAVRLGGVVAVYVWDYAAGMEPIRRFWDAAVALDPDAAALDEGARFPLCTRPALASRFEEAGLGAVEARAIDVPAVFRDFDDYWTPFLGGQFPAPDYALSLSEADRVALRDRIRAALPARADGSIHMIARAWAVRGTVRTRT
jgi:SAM-dependent methyltransferase